MNARLIAFSFSFLTVLVQAEDAPLVLENSLLRVEFEPGRPSVRNYLHKPTGETLLGDPGGAQEFGEQNFSFAAVFTDGAVEFPGLDPPTVSIEGDRIRYSIDLVFPGPDPFVSFDLTYILNGNTVTLVLENVIEDADAESKLVSLRTSGLIAVTADQDIAKLVVPDSSGRLVDVKTTDPAYYSLISHGGQTSLLSAGLYHSGLGGIVHYEHFDTELFVAIDESPGLGRFGTVGALFNYRYAPADTTNAAFIENFENQNDSMAIDIVPFSDHDDDGDVDWIDLAKVLRADVESKPNPFYSRSFIVKNIWNGLTGVDDLLDRIEKLFNLTDHAKLIVYMVSQQVDESGNPAVSAVIYGKEWETHPDFGTADEVRDAVRQARENFGATLSFHDIYYEYVSTYPDYDPAYRVVGPDGTPTSFTLSNANGTAFFTDLFDYMNNVGKARINETVAFYDLKDSYHIDVLSNGFIQDYSPASPTGKEKNRQGTQLIIDEFAKAGINVTSEALIEHFAESGIGWFISVPRLPIAGNYFSDAPMIPLLQFIYHGKLLYGLCEDQYLSLPLEESRVYYVLEALLLGASSCAHLTDTGGEDPSGLTSPLELEEFYLIDLPWMALNQREMTDYEESGSYRKISYDDDTFVEIDTSENIYRMMVDGRLVATNYVTFFQKSVSEFLLYSRDSQQLVVELPETWPRETSQLELTELTETGSIIPVTFSVDGSTLTFAATGGFPYKLKALTSPNPSSGGSNFTNIPHWSINEIYSNSDGTVQYIELFTTVDGQQGLTGRQITASALGVENGFSIPGDLSGITTGRTVLLATAAYEQLSGISPDFILPDKFIPPGVTKISFADVDSVEFDRSELPLNGTQALNSDLIPVRPNASNFLGDASIVETNINATFDSANLQLNLPVVDIPGIGIANITFILTNSDPVELTLADYYIYKDGIEGGSTAASFLNSTLTIPSLLVDGVYYTIRMDLIDENSIVFGDLEVLNVTTPGANDPVTGIASPIRISGTWSGPLTLDINGHDQVVKDITLILSQDGSIVIGTTHEEAVTGNVLGSIAGNSLVLDWQTNEESEECEKFAVQLVFAITTESLQLAGVSGRVCNNIVDTGPNLKIVTGGESILVKQFTN